MQKKFMFMTIFIISPLLVQTGSAAAKKKPQLPQPPANARVITAGEFQNEIKAGRLIPISTPTGQMPLSENGEIPPSLSSLRDEIVARLPETYSLLPLISANEIDTNVHLPSGAILPVRLLGAEFAAKTLARNLQMRSSPFNESLMNLQLAQLAPHPPSLLSDRSGPPQPQSCSQEIGSKHGLDLGKQGASSPSPSGILSQLNWPLKPYLTCVKDQGKRGSCTAFATASVLESAVAARDHVWINISEQSLYNQSKMLWSSDYIPALPTVANSQTDGYVTSDILNYAKLYSYLFPLESDWEYNGSLQTKTEISRDDPSKQIISHVCDGYSGVCSNTIHQGELVCSLFDVQFRCGYATAVRSASRGVRVKDYVELWNLSDPKGSLQILSAYLSAGQPLIASLAVTNRFLAIKNGFADVQEANPDPNNADQIIGYHAVALVGYVSRADLLAKLPNAPVNPTKESTTGDHPLTGYFIVKNQWGTKWGDAGYVYLPGDYLATNLLAVQAIADFEHLGLLNN